MPAAAEVDAFRNDVAALAQLAQNDVRLLFTQFDSPSALTSGLVELLPELVSVFGSASATLGADWYDTVRADENVSGRFRAITARLPDTGRSTALARWGVGPLFAKQPDYAAARTLISGGLQRIIADAARHTVTESSIADPAADGWQRAGAGRNCTFCAMLIGRGAVYREATAAFAAHDHCDCAAVPAFAARPRPVKPYSPSLRDSTPADRERVREYIRTH